MKIFIINLLLLLFLFGCQPAGNTNFNKQDSIILIQEKDLNYDYTTLSLLRQGDTMRYPFYFSADHISLNQQLESKLTTEEYLKKLEEILPYYFKQLHVPQNLYLILGNGIASNYPFKFNRHELATYLSKNKNPNTSYNSVIAEILAFSNLKIQLNKTFSPYGYTVHSFMGEKLSFDRQDIVTNLRSKQIDSIKFEKPPFIGVLYINFEKIKQ